MIRILLLFFSFVVPQTLKAQILPVDGSKLNYRIVGFSFPSKGKSAKYRIEIAAGNFISEDSFKANIIQTLLTNKSKLIVELPEFGSKYTWRVISSNDKNIYFYHFATLVIPGADKGIDRLRIIKQAEKHKDNYVFLDRNKALYDMKGHPVWFLPDVDTLKTENWQIRDLKLSPKGTITFLYDRHDAYEINYNGHILWKAPNNGIVNGEGVESYHHEFTKLFNGNYMLLGTEKELWNKHLPSKDSSFEILPSGKIIDENARKNYDEEPFGTIIEYDQHGDVVWSWKSSDYFRKSDIYYHIGRNGKPGISTHNNAFFFDEKNNYIYVGFRDISRIVKLKYPEGVVVASYGETYRSGVQAMGNRLFCGQHSVRRSKKGYLYLYDNNSCNVGSFPKLLKLGEPKNREDGLKKIWEHHCRNEDELKIQEDSYDFSSGGNVVELADYCLFANISGSYNKVFIISPNKKILWSGIPEKWNSKSNSWITISQYRASIISHKELEDLIWNAEQTPN